LDPDRRPPCRGVPVPAVSLKPTFVVYELATGPLNAGIFANGNYDTTLGPAVLTFFGPPTPESVRTWEEAKR
jgi:hypothetical protein